MNEQTLANDLGEDEALNLLHTLASADPDYPKIAKQLAPLVLLALPPHEQAVIAHATIEVLGQDPAIASAMKKLIDHPPAQRFEKELLRAGFPVVVVFLLRSHIHIEGKGRNLSFTIEHQAADSQQLTDLLNRIGGLLPTALE